LKTKSYLILTIILLTLLTGACRVAFVNIGKSENVRPTKLYRYINDNKFEYEYLTLKLGAEFITEDSKESFSSIVRIQKDSIIWISLRSYNIEGARLIITKDSVKFINRINNTYYLGDFEFLRNRFSLDIDYTSIQAILTNSFFFYPEPDDQDKAISSLKPCEDSLYYCMSSISQRKYTRYYVDEKKQNKWERRLEKESGDDTDENLRYETSEFVYQIIKVVPDIYRVHDMYIENHIQRQSLYISYDKQIRSGGQYFPREILVELLTDSFGGKLILSIESVSNDNESMSFPFKISDKYQEIIIE
jgi:hypothetical protein